MNKSYLSKIELRSLISLVSQLNLNGKKMYVDNAVSQHRAIMSLFPQGLGETPRAETGILFRVDFTASGLQVLMRSNIQPIQSTGVISMSEDFSSLEAGQYLRFRVTSSPIIRYRDKRNDKHKLRERFLVSDNEREDWIIKKFSQAFVEESIEVVSIIEREVKRDHSKNSTFIKLVQFDGIAQVNDRDSLEMLLLSGVGRNKNYGAGLLTIKLINS
jgi:CRISPR system Cascade subunit CasE